VFKYSTTLGVIGLAALTPALPSVRGDEPGPRCRAAESVLAPIRLPETLLPVLANQK